MYKELKLRYDKLRTDILDEIRNRVQEIPDNEFRKGFYELEDSIPMEPYDTCETIISISKNLGLITEYDKTSCEDQDMIYSLNIELLFALLINLQSK